ncbi:thiopurine S-methyltransferase [Candidatus Sulfurimonas marisnigri]|uniref:Thiopurine S-methyltransferase n=1 Tax=Candidatus Sulfurimonas marisnigri TaxID=2740405 RepID=A0A7S7M172_9BACT|nr:thiopurine S-methyltransferase [Candidatus Sulfurimonas marisnigri]QOY55262.1 thiopurine S-methyltransferase [Candidatus Sulfurimonas marisnigri]
MQADYWHNLWETNEIGFHQGDTNPFLLEFFSQLKLKSNSRVFIPLCGKTLDISWMLKEGYRVVGVELNESAVKELFRTLSVEPKLKEIGSLTLYSAKDIDIFVGDIFNLNKEILGSVDAIYDRAALVALPKEMRIEYTSHLMDITSSAPQFLINFEYEQRLKEGPPFSISKTEVQNHYSKFYDIKLLKSFKIEGGGFAKINAYENIWLLSS